MFGVLIFVAAACQGDTSISPGYGGQWGLCSWVPQDYNQQRVLRELKLQARGKDPGVQCF